MTIVGHEVPEPSSSRLPRGSALPATLTSFVGREPEIADALDLLAESRVVTLCGPGGVGKTRLALRVCEESRTAFTDGVHFVDLAAIVDGDQVPAAVAAALGVKDEAGATPAEAVAAHLSGRRTLLLLDNCEVVAEAVAVLSERLASSCGTALRILATSRVPLRTDAETLLAVGPLSLPSDTLAVGDSEAVRLFIDRARRVRRPFTLDAETGPGVVRLCRMLDGLPLAIELAAARVNVLTPEEIADALHAGAGLLRASDVGRPDRHRSLEACLAWSHELLTPPARALLARLSIFAGSFDLTAVRAVCWDRDVPEAVTVDLLGVLVDCSLVVPEDGKRRRFRMLETVRQFAADRADDDARLRERFVRWAASLAAEIGAQYFTGTQTSTRRLLADMPNLVRAVEIAVEDQDSGAGMAVLGPVWLMVGDVGVIDETVRLARLLLDGCDETPTRARGLVLLAMAQGLFQRGDIADALRVAGEAIALGELLGDEEIVGWASNTAGWARLWVHDRDAEPLLDRALDIGRRLDLPVLVAESLTARGTKRAMVGRWLDGGRADLDEALAITGDGRWDTCMPLATWTFTGAARCMAGDLHGALAAFDRSLRAVAAQPGSRQWFHSPYVKALQSIVFALQDRLDEAGDALRLAREAMTGAGQAYLRPIVDTAGAVIAAAAGERAEAMDSYLRAVAFGLNPHWVAWSRAGIADLLITAGDTAGARTQVSAVRDLTTRHDLPFHELRTERVLGDIARAAGDHHEAIARHTAALRRGYDTGLLLVAVEALDALAGLAACGDDDERAARLFGAAERLRAETGYGLRPATTVADREALASRLGDALDGLVEEGRRCHRDEALTLAMAGRGPRRRPTSGWDSLTPAERNVVRLVARGLSNPEIGQRLFISRRTVDRHVSNIFVKTGITARAELAAEAVRRGEPDG